MVDMAMVAPGNACGGGGGAQNSNSKKRTYLFELTEEEIARATKKVAFCDRIPGLAKIPDAIKKEGYGNARTALISVVDGLWRNPHLATACQTWLINRLAAAERPQGEGYFQTVPSILKHMDAEYMASFIIKHSKVSLRNLEAVSVFDPESLVQILCYALRCNPHMKIPESLIDKELMSLTLCKLMEKGGNSMERLTGTLVLTGGLGGINWTNAGCYGFEWGENDLATFVIHRPTGDRVEVPVYAPIHSSFKLAKNWSDFEATVTKKPVNLVLHTLFPEERGPHKEPVLTATSEMMSSALASAKTRQDELRKASRRHDGEGTGFKGDHKKAQQRELISARTALKTKKEELQGKRVVELTRTKKVE